MRRFLIPAVALIVFLVGCSGPTTPVAEQYFEDTKKNLVARDYEAALKNLDRLVKAAGDQPLGQQGAIVRTVLLTAMAEGTKQMGDAYREGAEQPSAAGRKGQFARMKTDYYGVARVRLMNAMEAVLAQRTRLGNQPMPLDLGFPDFTGQDHAGVVRVRNGQWAGEADRYHAELEAVRNALARTMARIVGGGDDPAKGKAVFDKGSVKIDPRVYLIELSQMFMQLSEIFDRRALDDPRYRRISLELVRDNLVIVSKMLEAKPDKELEARVKKLKAEAEKILKTLP